MSSGGGWTSPWRDHAEARVLVSSCCSGAKQGTDKVPRARLWVGDLVRRDRWWKSLFLPRGAPVSAKACRRTALAGCVAAALVAISPGAALAAGSGDPAGQA